MWLHSSYKYFVNILAIIILIQYGVHLIEYIETVLLDDDHIYTQYPGICSTIQDVSSLSLISCPFYNGIPHVIIMLLLSNLPHSLPLINHSNCKLCCTFIIHCVMNYLMNIYGSCLVCAVDRCHTLNYPMNI